MLCGAECPEDLAQHLPGSTCSLDTHQGSVSLGGPCSPGCGQRPAPPSWCWDVPHPSWCHLCALFAPDSLVLWGPAVTRQEHAA